MGFWLVAVVAGLTGNKINLLVLMMRQHGLSVGDGVCDLPCDFIPFFYPRLFEVFCMYVCVF